MSIMQQSLPHVLPSNVAYDAVAVENPSYDPIARQYSARVYGVCNGYVMPLIIRTLVAVRRVEDVVITDAEIDAVIAGRPDLASDRVGAAMVRAFQRIYALAAETPENPYAS